MLRVLRGVPGRPDTPFVEGSGAPPALGPFFFRAR
jgi:hypothetical protein